MFRASKSIYVIQGLPSIDGYAKETGKERTVFQPNKEHCIFSSRVLSNISTPLSP